MPSLQSAYALIDRSAKHLDELKVLHAEACEIQAKSTIVEFKSEGTVGAGQTIEMGEVRQPNTPVAIPIRILSGEVANCLRSALDYMVGQLALLDSGIRQERTQFPITDTPKDFKELRRRGFLQGVNDSHIAKIEMLQPYKGASWMRMLAVLSNYAKHDDLILLTHGVLISTEKFPDDPTDTDPLKHKMRVDFQSAIKIA